MYTCVWFVNTMRIIVLCRIIFFLGPTILLIGVLSGITLTGLVVRSNILLSLPIIIIISISNGLSIPAVSV